MCDELSPVYPIFTSGRLPMGILIIASATAATFAFVSLNVFKYHQFFEDGNCAWKA